MKDTKLAQALTPPAPSTANKMCILKLMATGNVLVLHVGNHYPSQLRRHHPFRQKYLL